MAFQTWQEPAALLSIELDKPDDALAELANTLGIDVVAGEPRLVVIARVEDEESRVTGVNHPGFIPQNRQVCWKN